MSNKNANKTAVGKELLLDEILVDDDIQVRARTDEKYVNHLKSEIKKGVKLDPIVVFAVKGKYTLADGFHRLAALQLAGRKKVKALVFEGGKRKAILFSINTNSKYGRSLTNADKRNAVLRMLNDKKWTKWSDRKIASKCGVSHTLVGKMRKELPGNGCQPTPNRKKAASQKNTTNATQKSEAKKNNEYYERKIEKKLEEHDKLSRILKETRMQRKMVSDEIILLQDKIDELCE